MNINSILSNAANLLTVVKEAPALWVVLASGLTSGLSKAKTIPPEWFLPGLALMIVSSVYMARRKIMSQILFALDVLSRSTALVHPSHFETICSEVIIDIAPNCKSATFKQTRTVKCTKKGIRHYQYRFYPECKFHTFRSNIGEVMTKDRQDGGVDVIVEFDSPIGLNKILFLELTCLIDEIFPSHEEYWCLKKYYLGKESYDLQIRFPKKRYPKTRYAETIDRTNNGKKRLLENLLLTVKSGKPTLQIKEDSLKINEDLYVRFTW